MKTAAFGLGVLLALGCSRKKDHALAETQVVEFLHKLDRAYFVGIYAAARRDFKTATPEKFSGGDGAESFNYRISGADASLLGYNINSQALITK